MKRIVFPYGQKGDAWYPLVDVSLRHRQKRLTVKALVDSGASFSIFRAEIADFLGLPVERGKALYLEGVGGRILGYLHAIRVRVDRKEFPCKIVFSREFTVSFNLLGRDNFFLRFLVTFDERKKQLVLQ